MTTAPAEQAPATMLDRVSSLLEAFDGTRRLTLAELARKANLPRSSTHRILQRLVDMGWVERHGFEYGLGMRIFELGSLVVRGDGIHRASLPIMHELHRRTGLTVHLSVLRGADVLHIERVGGWPQNTDGWQVGARQPAHHTAPGRALLARLDPAERPAPDLSVPPTAYSLRTHAQYERELYKVSDHGVAVDMQGLVLGIASVATVVGPSGRSPAALSLTGPAASLRTGDLVAHLRIAAADIWDAVTGVPRVGARRRPNGLPRGPRTGPASGPAAPRPRTPEPARQA
ncbi:IclR family transcriptional regulator [Spirillospora sp. NPDC046719]